MKGRLSRIARAGTAAILALGLLSGCGTFQHWERVGMPPSERGEMDVGMILSNIVSNLGLGIIVDAMTGAMWVPKSAQPWARRPGGK